MDNAKQAAKAKLDEKEQENRMIEGQLNAKSIENQQLRAGASLIASLEVQKIREERKQ